MLVDLHMHEATCSADSALRLDEMVAIARRLGLDGICITDHDSMGLRQKAEAYSRRVGFPIFVGVEYYSLQGDIVAFGIESFPQKRVLAQEFIDFVKQQGGVCFAAHPFRNNNRGLGHALATVQGLDGIEAFNGSTDFAANMQALGYCRTLGIQPLGVSDCHVTQKVGVYATRLPGMTHTMPAFLEFFRQGRAAPVGYIGGSYQDLLPLSDMLTPETCVLPMDKQARAV